MPDQPNAVGEALAYLVARMDAYCGTAGSDVLMYQDRDRRRMPKRMPAVEVLKAQALHYRSHRHLYPDGLRAVLDQGVGSLVAGEAVAGFVSALEARQVGKPGG